jgi:hypothetical protein
MALFFLPKAAPLVSGESLPFAQLTFYESGTSTLAVSYADAGLTTPHSSTVEADGSGLFPPIYLDDLTRYRVLLTDQDGAEIWDVDPFVFWVQPTDAIVESVNPLTSAEASAGVTPTDYHYHEGDPRRYGAQGDGNTDDTAALQAAIDVASVGGGRVEIYPGTYATGTLTIDANDISIVGVGRGATLLAGSSIPAGGAIILSLAGGADDASGNQSLINGLYTTGDRPEVRTAVTGSLENVHIEGIHFQSSTLSIKGVWFTGFTRGCRIAGCYFQGFDDHAICINGSWSFQLLGNNIVNDGTNGTGIGLGQVSKGTRAATSVVNAPYIAGNEIRACQNGLIWNFGKGGSITGNTIESNNGDAIRSQTVGGVFCGGNYFEDNDGDNLQLGGTNGTDFCVGWEVTGNYFTASAGNNIRLQGVQYCRFANNLFTGSIAQWYHIGTDIGQYITDCEIEIPAISGTYAGNATTELNCSYNHVHDGSNKKFINGQNGNYTFSIADPARLTYKSSGGAGATWTIPSNASVPMRVGTQIECFNNGGGNLTLAINTDTLVGSTTVSDGVGFVLKKVAATTWVRA